MMIGGLGIIRGQESGGSQTKVAPFWMDRYPSEIGDEMSAIENEAWVEAVARSICAETYGRCTCAEGYADYRVHCDDAERSARAAIHALAPLIIERCADVAERYDRGTPWDEYHSSDYDTGARNTARSITQEILLLIPEEASEPTANEPAGHASMIFEEMAELATRMREQAIEDAALRVLATVSGSKVTIYEAQPGVLPTSSLFVVFVAPEVMARLRELTKGA